MEKYDSLGLSHLVEDAGIKILRRYKELTPSTTDLDNFSITINFTSSNEYDIDVYSNYKFCKEGDEKDENGEE